MLAHPRPLLTLCLLSTACLPLGCGGDDGESGDEVGETSTDTGTGTETETGDTNTESGDTADTTTTDDDVDTTTADTTEEETTAESTEEETTADTTEEETTAESTEGDGVCGNSIIEMGEDCDDGNLSDADGCLSSCVDSSCGDGFINMGVEVCDDGTNDGSYGGCAANCQALGPYCGDTEINGPEVCDDGNDDLADGCMDNCVIPASCLTLIEYDDTLTDGAYQIAPEGYNGAPIPVWCDMTTDGGGYTFLKIDAGAQTYAVGAEAECATYGMQLWIPRSQAHKDSGWTIANDNNVGNASNADFMRILGIYPSFNGASCANTSMNSSNPNCGWEASDGGPWYVHDVNNISEPNGDNSVTGSMYYQWNGGQIEWHNDIGGAGYSSAYFMCDVGDKLP
jgi:cysteine-rich repeat protein